MNVEGMNRPLVVGLGIGHPCVIGHKPPLAIYCLLVYHMGRGYEVLVATINWGVSFAGLLTNRETTYPSISPAG